MSLGLAALGDAPLADEAASGGGASFSIAPSVGHATGVIPIAATGSGTSWTGANPFSVSSGPGTISNYANVSGMSATFDLTVSAVGGGPIVIHDSDSNTDQNYNNAAVVPGVPTGVTITDNGNGTITVTYSQPADNGGAAISANRATLSNGQTENAASAGAGITFAVSKVVDLVAITATVRATNSVGNSSESSASGSVTPNDLTALEFTRCVTYVTGTAVGTGNAYRVCDATGADLTGWITVGLADTPNMTAGGSQPDGQSVNYKIHPSNADGTFAGYMEVRNASSSPEYQRCALNLYPQGFTRGATVKFFSLHTFLPGDTISSPTVYAFTSNGTAESSLVAETNTGVVTVSAGDKCYGYLVSQTPDAFGGLQAFIRWGTTTAGKYDIDRVFVSARSAIAGDVRVSGCIAFPSGTTIGTVKWQAQDRGGSIGSYVTSGLVAVTGMTSGAGQSLGYTLEATLPANNANGSFSGVLKVRAADAGPHEVAELNIQATAGGNPTVSKLAPFLSTDVFTAGGFRPYDNALGTDSALAARSAALNAISEIANGYFVDYTITSGADVFLLWDEDAALYMNDAVEFMSVASTTSGGSIGSAEISEGTGISLQAGISPTTGISV